jgi:hypothetical protein
MAVRMGRKWQPNGSCCATSQVHAIAVCIAPLSRATDAVRNECVHGGRLGQVHVGSSRREGSKRMEGGAEETEAS